MFPGKRRTTGAARAEVRVPCRQDPEQDGIAAKHAEYGRSGRGGDALDHDGRDGAGLAAGQMLQSASVGDMRAALMRGGCRRWRR